MKRKVNNKSSIVKNVGRYNAIGTCSNFIDWKHGKQMQFFNQLELGIYMQQRWRDDVLDIQEHYQLDTAYVAQIIFNCNKELLMNGQQKLKFLEGFNLITDLLLLLNTGNYEAICVRSNFFNLSKLEIEKLWITKKYWESKGVKFSLLDRLNLNPILVQNIRLVTEYYNKDRVYDEISAIKYLIAHKLINLNLEDKVLNLEDLHGLLNKEVYSKICQIFV